MKKIFVVLLIAGSLAACNNSGESKSGMDTATTSTGLNGGGDTTDRMGADSSAGSVMDTSVTGSKTMSTDSTHR